MSVVRFRDDVFLDYKGNWFLWEPSWEKFRPIDAVQWDGSTFQIVDTQYCSDPMDEWYGYGSEKMKELCDALEPFYYKGEPKQVESLAIGNSEWFRDRLMALSPCAPRDKESWKRMCHGRTRTCRRPPRVQKLTRRSIK